MRYPQIQTIPADPRQTTGPELARERIAVGDYQDPQILELALDRMINRTDAEISE